VCQDATYGFREKENLGKEKAERKRRGFKEKFCFVELFGKMCGT
jgi:hypothetical protein